MTESSTSGPLAAARAEFLRRGRLSPRLPTAISSSWLRSLRAGVDADAADVPYSSPEADSPLTWAARRPLHRLESELAGLPVGAVLADADGRVMRRVAGGRSAIAALDRIQLRPGADFGEQAVGTNGVGTVVVTGRPILVASEAHYRGSFLDYACAGAPIVDAEGSVLGVLDLTARRSDADTRMQHLAAVVARRITHLLQASGAGMALQRDRSAGSSLWRPALHDTVHALRNGQSLLMIGEPGTGRLTLLEHALSRVHPGARPYVVRPDRVRLGLGDLASHADRGERVPVVVFTDVQQLDDDEIALVQHFLARPKAAGWPCHPVVTAAPPVLREQSPVRRLLPYVAHTVLLPPLRQRGTEFPQIVREVADRLQPGAGARLGSAAIARLAAASWPGNIAELTETVSVLLNTQDDGPIDRLPDAIIPRLHRFTELQLAQRREIAAELAWNGGNRTAAAKSLGISRAALYRKIDEFGLT